MMMQTLELPITLEPVVAELFETHEKEAVTDGLLSS